MSRFRLLSGIFVCLITGLGVGYQIGVRVRSDTGPPLALRSKTTVENGFAPPGAAGEVRRALLEPDLLERAAALSTLLDRLGPEALDPVREAYDSVLLDMGDVELVLFGHWWARFDPAAALAWTRQNWNTRNSIPVLRAVMRAWGQSDPDAAMAATRSAPNNAIRRRWVDSVLRGWDESVHDGALEWVDTLGPGPERQWALYVVTRRRVLRDGPEAAIAWAEALPDDDKLLKLNAFRRVAAAVAEVDGPRAVAFAQRHLDGPYAKGLPRRVGMHWVTRQPRETMQWLSSLPAGPNRDDGVMETYRQWLGSDRAAAMDWLPDAENDGWLDPAVSVYARSIARHDPPVGIEWAIKIHDAKLRLPTIGTIARRWLMHDAASANAWLDQSGLPQQFVEKIRVLPKSKPVGEPQ